ncbi:MAG: hypothetical protein HRU20_29570, partial [Pseudomonadales bacterium]|nr:hypothetical protein [Pseudomonadales bacterium]
MNRQKNFLFTLLMFASSMSVLAQEVNEGVNTEASSENLVDDKADIKKESPWIFTPLISSDPKMKTSIGVLAAYMHKFDENSPVSMFGISAKYSSSASYTGGIFARTYFNNDKSRLIFASFGGKIKNTYSYDIGAEDDVDVKTSDDLQMTFLRFSERVYGDWFIGMQLINSNYIIEAYDDFSDEILAASDLTGFDSKAVGLVFSFDNRDNQHSASSGSNFIVHNLSYKERFGGDVSFDSYMLEYSNYIAHGEAHVFSWRVKGRWTKDAPNSGFSSMKLRGYVQGQYLAEHSTTLEFDERYALNDRWGLTAFAGIGCLYGNDLSGKSTGCDSSDNLYPSAGAGMSYMLKPQEKMVVRAEIAVGKGDNYGFYLNFG